MRVRTARWLFVPVQLELDRTRCAEDDFIVVEPALHHDDLRHGVRLEKNSFVTSTGVELLTPWLLELA